MTMKAENTTSSSSTHTAAQVSRRAALVSAVGVGLTLALPNALTSLRAEPAPLPPGAAEIANILAARERWSELGATIRRGELDDGQWDNARLYLRAFYSVGTDMRKLAKPWDTQLKARVETTVKDLQTTVRGMDPAARDHDAKAFLDAHQLADNALAKFLETYRDAAAADVPDEL